MHPLPVRVCLWGASRKGRGDKQVVPLGSASTVEEFWGTYAYLQRPFTVDVMCFRAGIRPVWEDDINKRGGKWVLSVRKSSGSRLFEALVLAFVGGQFEESLGVCGVCVGFKASEAVLSVWNRNSVDVEAVESIRKLLLAVVEAPSDVNAKYVAFW